MSMTAGYADIRAYGAGIHAWGKLSHDRCCAHSLMHPLEAHMLDVAACFTVIAGLRGVRRTLERVAGRALNERDIARLSALAFLHDIGKANSGFQSKRWSALEQRPPQGWPAPAGHTGEALHIFSNDDLLSLLPAQEMSEWGFACPNLLHASISHHGRPVQGRSQIDPKIWQPVKTTDGTVVYDPRDTLKRLATHLKAWFPLAFDPGGAPLPDSPQFAHLFAGLVQFADWLGSDTDFFPYAQANEDRNATAWEMAERAVQAIGIDTRSACDALPQGLDFASVFQVPAPRPIQARMSDATLGRLLILESETGSGKTEAALWRFAHLFKAGQVDGLYFALPTRVAATQIYERTLKFTQQLWREADREAPLVVRALPGYVGADGHEVQCKLPDFDVLWADHPDEQKAHKRWSAESSKRFLAAPLAVGTIDQALMGALQVRHAHMRYGLLSRSLLVVDEVHASDAYMSTLLAHLLKAHLHAGGHALLLSATLGSSARHRYQKLLHPEVAPPTLDQALTLPYPALSDGLTTSALPDSVRSKQVHWQAQDCIDRPEDIAALALHAARQGAKVLVIRNTVPAAVATFRALEQQALECGLEHALFHLNGVRTVHHGRFSREDRPLLDKAVEKQIGKDRSLSSQACVVVGTQTLEQSLDIDADLLISDLCPMDVLLQRVGRLHRHDRAPTQRPVAYRTAQAVVLTPPGQSLESCLKKSRHGLGRFHNGGGIYADLRILEATRRLICAASSHRIPQDNRMLVERATHPEALRAIEQDLGWDWIKHGQEIDGECYAKQVQGNLNVLPFDKPFVDEAGNELSFPDSEQKVTSRLGAADYLLTFDPPMPGPFGHSVCQLPMRHHMWPQEAAPDEQPVIQAQIPGGGFIFSLAKTTYRYSRLGLERLTEPHTGVSP